MSARELQAALAQQLAYAKDLREALGQARALREAIIAVREEVDPHEVLRRLAAETRRLTSADAVEVLIAAAAEEPVAVAATESGDGRRISPIASLVGLIAARSEPLWLTDTARDGPVPHELSGSLGVRSLGLLPIVVDGAVYGSLAVAWWRQPHQFARGERESLAALATSAGVALERASLRAELQARAQGAEALHRVAAAVAGQRDVAEIANHALTALSDLFHAHAGAFYLIDPPTDLGQTASGGAIHAVAASALSESGLASLHNQYAGGRRGQFLRAGRSQVIRNTPDERRSSTRDAMAQQGATTLVAVPATFQRKTIGCLLLCHGESRSYRSWEIKLLETFAEQLAGAIELAGAYARVEAIDRQREEFLALISHELRQPVAAIAAVADALADSSGLEARERQALDGLRGQARCLARLAEDLLAVAHLESGHFTLRRAPTDLPRLVAAQARQTAEPERVQVAGDLRTPLLVDADPERIGQVLDNLLGNALKYSPPGSPITVTVGDVDGQARVEVTDQGLGLDSDGISRLFMKYGRLRNGWAKGIDGVGLGLYLTRLIVEAHGGSITASSPGPGRGSTFAVTLPRAAGTPVQRPGAQLST